MPDRLPRECLDGQTFFSSAHPAEAPYRGRMAVIHFVVPQGARLPLCGHAEATDWIETRFPGSVTCDACAKLLSGVRCSDPGASPHPSAWTIEGQ